MRCLALATGKNVYFPLPINKPQGSRTFYQRSDLHAELSEVTWGSMHSLPCNWFPWVEAFLVNSQAAFGKVLLMRHGKVSSRNEYFPLIFRSVSAKPNAFGAAQDSIPLILSPIWPIYFEEFSHGFFPVISFHDNLWELRNPHFSPPVSCALVLSQIIRLNFLDWFICHKS